MKTYCYILTPVNQPVGQLDFYRVIVKSVHPKRRVLSWLSEKRSSNPEFLGGVKVYITRGYLKNVPHPLPSLREDEVVLFPKEHGLAPKK